MRIDISRPLTIADLLNIIGDAPSSTTLEFIKTPKRQQTGCCWCGCGETTKSRFAPGHDSKFHSLAKQVARGLAEMPESFVNEDAEADFMKWHDKDLANPPKVKTPKAPKVKLTKEDRMAEVQTEIADAVEESVVEESATEALDPDSDEFKALLAMVSMS